MTMTLRKNILASRRWRIALGILAIALPATADAPKNPPQYDQFDQDTLAITDKFTTLQWDRRRVQQLNQANGQTYCNATVFPGQGRLPTVKELLTLVDEDPHEEYDTTFKPPIVLKSIDQGAFPNTPTREAYWTSTPATDGSFWTVEFTAGRTKTLPPTTVLNVRCVK
jgi:hypothetical protein